MPTSFPIDDVAKPAKVSWGRGRSKGKHCRVKYLGFSQLSPPLPERGHAGHVTSLSSQMSLGRMHR